MAIETPDPAATILEIQAATPVDSPILKWDCCNGLEPVNEAGQIILGDVCSEMRPQDVISPVEALILAKKLPAKTILFTQNMQRFLLPDNPAVAQAVWNLRDKFKSNSRTLVMLGPTFVFPEEVAQDILRIDEALPNEGELRTIVTQVCDMADVTVEAPVVEKAVDALRGLAAFPAEQATAMSMVLVDGVWQLDVDGLWERKRQMIEATPGLTVGRSGSPFKEIGGVERAKE